MRAMRLLASTMTALVLLAGAAQAQDVAEVRRLTLLTFSEAVQLPGMTLPAGTYRFEMADINNAPHTVRVSSEDGQKVLGTFHTIPSRIAQRDLTDQETLVMFAERPAGQPQAAKEWFYPGRSTGEEFVYPKDQAMAIARANRTSVAADDDGKAVRVDGTGAVTPSETARAPLGQSEAPAESVARTGQSEQDRPVGTSGQAPARETSADTRVTRDDAPAATQSAQAQDRPRELPRTGSGLGLIGLFAGLSLAGAFGARHMRLRADARR